MAASILTYAPARRQKTLVQEFRSAWAKYRCRQYAFLWVHGPLPERLVEDGHLPSRDQLVDAAARPLVNQVEHSQTIALRELRESQADVLALVGQLRRHRGDRRRRRSPIYRRLFEA